MIGAGLLLASFREVLSVDPGFDPRQVLTARLSLPESRYGGNQEVQTFSKRLEDAVRELPGVRAAGLTNLLPLSGDDNKSTVTVEGYQLSPGEGTPTPHNSWDPGQRGAKYRQ